MAEEERLGEPAEPATIAKPDELLALHGVAAHLFAILRRWFDVPPSISLDLTAVDSAVVELGEPRLIAAMAMRKLQALHLLSTPGVRTSTDVVVAIVQDLQRALVQAPAMRLKLQAATTDWDAALRDLDDGAPAPAGVGGAPTAGDDADPEVDEFRALHALVIVAVEAVIAASEGEIRYLV
jgi:hypothetical protein